MNKLSISKIKKFLIGFYNLFSQNDLPFLAAGIAYFALFSLFPLLLFTSSVIGYIVATPEVKTAVIDKALTLFPSTPKSLIDENLNLIVQARASSGILALLISLWTGLNVFGSLSYAINKILSLPPLPFARGRLKALIIIVLIGLLLVASIAIDFLFAIVSNANFIQISAVVVRYSSAIVLSSIAFFIIYRFIIDNSFPLKHLAAVSLFVGVSLEILKKIFAFYLQVSNFSSSYGLITSSIALLLWIYLSSLLLLIGALLLKLLSRPISTLRLISQQK